MDHVIQLADRAMVLRQGRKVGEIVPEPGSRQEIVTMIVGARILAQGKIASGQEDASVAQFPARMGELGV